MLKYAHFKSQGFKSLKSQYIFMYLLKDMRSFTYKLSPVLKDKNSISLLNNHSQKKELQDHGFEQFKSSRAHEYIGLEHRLLQDPNLIVPPSTDQDLSRLYLQKIKLALNLLYKQKNKLNDAVYHIKRRSNYFKNVKEPIQNNKIDYLVNYFKEDLETIQDVMKFIKNNAIASASLPLIDTSLFLTQKLGEIVTQFSTLLPACKKIRELLNARIWEVKQVKQIIKKNLTLQRYPQKLQDFQEIIQNKVDYNFFLNRWMANHFILDNYDLKHIEKIKNGKSTNGYKIKRSGEYKVLYNKLRKGFSSSDKTVQILHDKLGTPPHLEDRAVRNALVLAADTLKSQEQRMKILNQIHEHFENHIKELEAFLEKNSMPIKLFEALKDEKYFYLNNILGEYKNSILTFLKVLECKFLKDLSGKELQAYLQKVFEHTYFQVLNLFLAHSLKDRTFIQLQENKPFLKFVMNNMKIDIALEKKISTELDNINFEGYITNTRHVNFTNQEKDAFITFLKWTLKFSFILFKFKSNIDDISIKITKKVLKEFKQHSYFQEAPLQSQDVILFHGDDGKRMLDATWNHGKISGTISEIQNFNAHHSKSLQFRLKLLDDNNSSKSKIGINLY